MQEEKAEWSQEQLAEIEKFAEGLLSPKKICTIMGISFSEHKLDFDDPEHPLGRAYAKGALMLEYRLNIKNIKFAEQASSHAMNKVLRQIEEREIQRRKDREQ